MSTDDFPRVPLLFGASPIHPLPRLSAALGGAVEIRAKREDCNSYRPWRQQGSQARVSGGRRPAQGCDTLVSIGGVEPHPRRHRRGQASRPRRGDRPGALGRLGRSRVRGRGQYPATRIMGGDIRMDRSGFDIGIRDSWRQALESVMDAGGKLPDPRGRVRSSPWRSRVRELGPRSRGTRSTARSVVRPRHSVLRDRFDARRDDRGSLSRGRSAVIGIDASGTRDKTLAQVIDIARATAAAIGVERELRDDEITLVDGYAGPVYGVPDEGTIEAIQLAARTDGMITTPSTRASRWPASSASSARARSSPVTRPLRASRRSASTVPHTRTRRTRRRSLVARPAVAVGG